jgi:hypothetical protein
MAVELSAGTLDETGLEDWKGMRRRRLDSTVLFFFRVVAKWAWAAACWPAFLIFIQNSSSFSILGQDVRHGLSAHQWTRDVKR